MNNTLTSNGNFNAFDFAMMEKALALAKLGIYSTQPNPRVGCVIVDEKQQIVGEGYHQKAGQAHAEVNALEQAGNLSKGACAYVTLEPCAHTGKTPPCAKALVKAGISKVFIACLDPNPLVSGKGISILQAANIEVKVGLLEAQALHLNEAFFFRMQNKRPFISIKLASSLDGKTALANGDSKWITGTEARQDVQKHRANACAILTGADTVIADNPQLNVRQGELSPDAYQYFVKRGKQPLRVVIDSQNRLSASQWRLFNDGESTLVYNTRNNVNISADQQQQVSIAGSFVDLHEVLKDLASREINHLWVESGAKLCGALLSLGLVNELILYQAPKILGSQARGLINVDSKESLNDALMGTVKSVEKVGADTKTVFSLGKAHMRNKT